MGPDLCLTKRKGRECFVEPSPIIVAHEEKPHAHTHTHTHTDDSPHRHQTTHQLWAADFNGKGSEKGADGFGHQGRCEQQQMVVDEHIFLFRGKLLHAAYKPLWGFSSLSPDHTQQLFLKHKHNFSQTPLRPHHLL